MDQSRAVTENTEQADPQAAEPDPQLSGPEALQAERDRLQAEREELQDRLLRRTAEFDNFRRRVEREKSEYLDYAAGDVIKPLLPILDDMERAVKAAPADDEFAKGMDLIRQRFAETLKKLGVEPILCVGQPFDPNLHHAVEMAQTDEAEDQTVLAEYQPGYQYKGRLLRPALVKVAVNP